MEFVIITGLSGAGKSVVVDAMEDIGFYCVDNLPAALIPRFAELCQQSQSKMSKVALVMDIRSGNVHEDLEVLSELKKQCAYKILFLECDDQVLARRYKETRRTHPLAVDNNHSNVEALEKERMLMKPLRARTDFLIDTSHLSTSQLKSKVVSLFAEDASTVMTVECMSFGFKYGYPAEADLVFDTRCLPNPFYVPELKHCTGLDKGVRDFVMSNDKTAGLLERLYSLIDYLLPLYRSEGKSQLVIAIGCTGGKHRSVVLTEQLAQHISEQKQRVIVNHRDISKL